MKWKSSYLSELQKSMRPGAKAELITARKMFGDRKSIGLGTIAAYRMDPKQRLQRLHYVMACAKWGTLSDGDKAAYEAWAEENAVTVFSSFLHSYLTDLKNNLVLYLPMDEITGATVKDYSKYANDGTETDVTIQKGEFIGNSLDFNGTSSFVNCGSDASLNVGNVGDIYSLSSWFKTNAAGEKTIAMKWGGTLQPLRVFVYTTATVYLYDGANTSSLSSTVALNDGVWHHIAAVIDRENIINLYIDGHFDNSGGENTVGDLRVANDLCVGVRLGVGSYFNGYIDELRLYKKSLTHEEILAIYRQESKWHGDTA